MLAIRISTSKHNLNMAYQKTAADGGGRWTKSGSQPKKRLRNEQSLQLARD
jgi:hypothetical protein